MAAGLLGQLGIKSETTWGTPVTVDQFHPGYLSNNPVVDQPPLVSKGIRAGRRLPTSLRVGKRVVQGQFKTELYTLPLATYLRHMFGTIGVSGAGPYTHTASIGPLNGKSFTAQVGIPGTGGVVHPFTYNGCKIPEWTLAAKSGELATLDLNVSAKDYVTATGLAAASYGAGVPFTFIQGAVTIAGVSQANVDEFTLSCKRPLRVKHPIGSATIIEQLEEGQPEMMIDIKTEFTDLVLHNLLNTAIAVILAFTDGANTLTITCNMWVTPTTPENEGVDAISKLEFGGMLHGSTDAAACTAVLVNTEVTNT